VVALEEGEEEAEGLEALGGRVVHGEHDEGVELEEGEDVGGEAVGQDGEHVVHGVEEVGGEGLEGGLVGVRGGGGRGFGLLEGGERHRGQADGQVVEEEVGGVDDVGLVLGVEDVEEFKVAGEELLEMEGICFYLMR